MNRTILEYMDKKSWRINENANTNYSYSGLLSFLANRELANYALRVIPKGCSRAHISGDIHIHNLESGCLIPYCHGGSLYNLLMKGLNTAVAVTKPAKHLSTVVDHVANYFMISQLEFSGAQSFSDFDTLLAPFIHYDNLSYKEVKQNIQRLIYNINFTSRNSYQTPFTNLSFNINCPKSLSENSVVIGGELKDAKYSDFNDEAEMINRAFAEIYLERDASGRPFTFPIPTINIVKDLKWDIDIMDTIFMTESVLGNYYFMNYIGTGYNEYTIRAMCCRLNLDMSKLEIPRGLFYAGEGTGSLGVVTINMPRIGYLSRDDNDLLERLDKKLELAKDLLVLKAKLIEKSLKIGLLPFSSFYDLDLNRYFCTIGVIGLNEMCINFTGKDIIDNIELVKKILLHIRDRIEEFNKETKRIFNLELVPGEGSSYRLALIDRKRYKGIKTLGTSKAPYYTSLIVPPQLGLDIFDQIRIEEEILPLFTGGTVSRIFFGEQSPDYKSLMNFSQKMMRTRIPYQDYSATFSVCVKEKKFFRGVLDKCPECNAPVELFARVVGYYRQTFKWNKGKQQEFNDRKYQDIVS